MTYENHAIDARSADERWKRSHKTQTRFGTPTYCDNDRSLNYTNNTPNVSVYVQCQICGIDRCEIDKLIKIMRNSGSDRKALLRWLEGTFEGDTPPIDCSACAKIIFDVE